MNLLENAARYAPAGSAGRDRRAAPGPTPSCSRSATAAPASPRRGRAHLRPASTAPSTPPPGKGVGLGLAVAKGFVEAMGGTIAALDRQGGGSVFRLSFPAELMTAARARSRPLPPSSAGFQPSMRARCTVRLLRGGRRMSVTLESGEHVARRDRHAAAPTQAALPGLRAGLDRRRLRRYRHQPALRHARGAASTRRRAASPARRSWASPRCCSGRCCSSSPRKYVLFLMRADNRGEGGTLSLMALAQRALGGRPRAVFMLGVAGAALFYGDALITPAISVLSAVEGLKLVTPVFEPYVIPITVGHPVRAVRGAAARHRQGGGLVRADHRWSGSWSSAASACSISSDDLGVLAVIQSRCTPYPSWPRTASSASPSWAACSWPSRVPRRSMPTWAISAAARSRQPGSCWSSRRWR